MPKSVTRQLFVAVKRLRTYLDLSVHSHLLLVELVVVVGVHLEVVESKFLLDTLLECLTLLQSQSVGLGNDGNNIDDIGQLLQNDDIDGLERVAGRLDEEQTAVDAGVLNITLTLSGKLLSQVSRVLVLDVLDDGIPAAVVVDQITVARGVNNVKAETDTILLDVVGNGVDLGRGSNNFFGNKTTLGLDKVRSEDGVDEGRFSETSLTYLWEEHARHVSQAMRGWGWRNARQSNASKLINLPTQITLNWKPRFNSFFSIWLVMLSKPTWLWG